MGLAFGLSTALSVQLLPGFLLADSDSKPTAAAEAVLRKGEALSLTGN